MGHAVNNPSVPLSFPTDDSQGAKIARMQASLVTLQNLNGPGKGCPAVSTTFSAQLSALQSGGAAAPPPPAAAPPPPAPAPPPPAAAGAADSATVARLAPQLNFNAGVNPTGASNGPFLVLACAHFSSRRYWRLRWRRQRPQRTADQDPLRVPAAAGSIRYCKPPDPFLRFPVSPPVSSLRRPFRRTSPWASL